MRPRVLAAVAVVLLSVAVPTAAVATQRDDAGPVTLAPHEGPNGRYATVEGGELRVDFERLNDEAVTTAHDVFTITGSGEGAHRVWVETGEGVTAYRGDDPTEAFDGEPSAVTLAEGETIAVGFELDTHGTVPDSGVVTVHAVPVNGSETGEQPGSGSGSGSGPGAGSGTGGASDGDGAGDPGGTGDATTPATETPAGPDLRVVDARLSDDRILPGGRVEAVATVANRGGQPGTTDIAFAVDGEVVETATVTVPAGGSREVRFGRTFGTPGRYTLRVGGVTAGEVVVEAPGAVEVVGPDGATVPDVAVTELDELPADGPATPPSADVELLADTAGTTGDGVPVVGRGEPVTLSGGSTVGTAGAIGGRPVRIVDVSVPGGVTRGTVRIHVERSAFDDAPDGARVARFEDGDWQLLPTRVADRGDGTVVLEAETDGFGVFAVFSGSGVRHEWSLPNGTTAAGERVRTTFEDAGRHDLSFTVTDADGRTDTAVRQVLVNDRPAVTIERVGNATGNGTVTLRANVTDDVGNATVTWTFPDGSRATGLEVTRAFESGDTVRVTVTDEFGASATAERTVTFGPPARSAEGPLAGLDVEPLGLPVAVLAGLVLGGVALAVLLVRWPLAWNPGLPFAPGALFEPFVDRSPRITAFEGAEWDPESGWLDIAELAVESPRGLLDTIEITVTDASGAVVVRKTIDVSAADSYAASPERIRIPGDADADPGGRYDIAVRAVDEYETHGSTRHSSEGLFAGGSGDPSPEYVTDD